MNKSRRDALTAMSALALSGLTQRAAAADAYPARAMQVIVPRAPGGGSDILARLLAPGMQKRAGQPFVVENRPDASAVIGASAVARAAPDGYTVFLADNAFYQNPAVLKSLPYDTIKDFTGVTMLAQGPVILIVHPSLPVTNVKELVEYARANPGKLSYGSGGIGASTHLSGVLFDAAAGVKTVHVPFKSSGPALSALLGGHIQMQWGGISSARPHIESGKVRAIAVTGSKRDPSMPNVPTFEEAGLKGVDITSIWGMHCPAGTPLAIRRTLRDMLVEVMRTPETTARMNELGYDIVGSTPEEHDAETRRLVAFWIDLGKRIDIKAE
jgi:tripartite-type tricarboxylate transporter receptor subunit TctC